MFKQLIYLSSFLFVFDCMAEPKMHLVNGLDGAQVSLPQSLREVRPGTIVVASENHDFEPHHHMQLSILNQLKAQGLKLTVGMEFFEKTAQSILDQFLRGLIPEPDFLRLIKWGSNKFSNYRNQVLFGPLASGWTIGLNADRKLTSKIAKVGINGLTEQERAEIPKNFQVGNGGYFERFSATMSGHVPEEAIMRYFEAQSVWDETMATTAIDYLEKNPDQTLVIIVGEFHAAYRGGLPDRIQVRSKIPTLVFSQLNLTDATPIEIKSEIEPHPKYGPRGDFVGFFN